MVESASKTPVAIVTGAGGGIGCAICIELAKAGYHISLVGRSETSLQATVNEIAVCARQVPQSLVVPADLSDHRQFTNIVQRTYQHWGKIDVLINNAAACPNFPIDQTTIQELQEVFALNYFAPALLVAELWPIFVQQGFGCVINISSIATVDPFPGLSMYAASKAAMESLTRSIINEAGEADITSYSIAPGAVETAMLRSLISIDDLPTDKTLNPATVASVVLDCVLGRRKSDNGKTIVLEKA